MTDGSRNIDSLVGFAERHGEEGLRVLLLFRLIKLKIRVKIRRENPDSPLRYSEEQLNEFCLEKAQQLAQLGKGEVKEDEINSLLNSLAKKTQTNHTGERSRPQSLS